MTSSQPKGPGSRTTRRRGGWLRAGAERLDRILTWGIDPEEREQLLVERAADRCDHLADPDATLFSVLARTLRSALADVGYRLFGGDVSAFPVAVMFAVLGLGAMSDTLTSDMPAAVAVSNAVTGVGFVAMAVAGLIRPSELRRAWLLPGAFLASLGTSTGAMLLPVTAEAALFDWINKASLAAAGIGLALIAVSVVSHTPSRSTFIRGGAILWISAFVFAIGQFGWAIVATPVYSTRTSTLIVALAAVAGAAVISRLRHLPIAS